MKLFITVILLIMQFGVLSGQNSFYTPFMLKPTGFSMANPNYIFPTFTINPPLLGPDYGCMSSNDNLYWAITKSCFSSNVNFSFGMGTFTNGLPIINNPYFSMIIWGPYQSIQTSPTSLEVNKIVYCEDSIDIFPVSSNLTYDIHNNIPQPGDIYYMAFKIYDPDNVADSIGISFLSSMNSSYQDSCNICNDKVTLLTESYVCNVNYDTTSGKNMINWHKIHNTNIAGYQILKSSNIDPDTVWATSLSEYIDYDSSPLSTTYTYRVVPFDSCGYTTIAQEFPFVASCHLQSYPGFGGLVHLQWTHLYSNLFPTVYQNHYRIYRGPDFQNMVLIDSVYNGYTQYTDVNAPPGVSHYQIERLMNYPCVPARLSSVSTYGSTSNFTSVMVTGNQEVDLSNLFSLTPNPVQDQLVVNFQFPVSITFDVEIRDVAGRIIFEHKLMSNEKNSLDVSALQSGVYFFNIKEQLSSSRRFVKIR